jgi:hypothetical protein
VTVGIVVAVATVGTGVVVGPVVAVGVVLLRTVVVVLVDDLFSGGA